MSNEDNKKNRILEFSFKRFTTAGIIHVTMDEIARGVGIGKATLYQYFPSKEALIFETIDFMASRIEKNIHAIVNNQELNPVEKLEQLIQTIGKHLSKVNPSAIAYLEKNFPKAYEKIIEIRQQIIMNNVLTLLEDGIKSGHFDSQIDAYLVTNILIGAANHITNADILTTLDYSLDNLFSNIVTIIMKGCLSEDCRRSDNIPSLL